MKNKFVWSLLLLFPLLQACPPVNTNRLGRKLKENHMNFPKWEKANWQGNSFNIPADLETENDSKSYTLSDENVIYSSWEISSFFIFEEFNTEEAENFKYIVGGQSNLEAVHEGYVKARSKKSSYRSFRVSQRKKLKLKYQNFSTVVIENFIRESSYDNASNVMCFITTLKKKNKIYVIQLSGRADKMPYLYDDYLKIVKSFK